MRMWRKVFYGKMLQGFDLILGPPNAILLQYKNLKIV